MQRKVLTLIIISLVLALISVISLVIDIWFNFAPDFNPLAIMITWFVFTFPQLLYIIPVSFVAILSIVLLILTFIKKHPLKLIVAISALVISVILTLPVAKLLTPTSFIFTPLVFVDWFRPTNLFEILAEVIGLISFILLIVSTFITMFYHPVDRRKVIEAQLLNGEPHPQEPIVLATPEVKENKQDEAKPNTNPSTLQQEEEKVILSTEKVKEEESKVTVKPKSVSKTKSTSAKTKQTASPQADKNTPPTKSDMTAVVPKPRSKVAKVTKTIDTPSSKTSSVKKPRTRKVKVSPTPDASKPDTTTAKVAVTKPSKDAKPAVTTDTKRVYHLNKRESDNKWTVVFRGSKKVLKLFDTQKEAIAYVQVLCANNGGTYLIHNSKGQNKGRIKKKS